MFGGPCTGFNLKFTAQDACWTSSSAYCIALISFNDSSAETSHIKLIRQGSALDIGKLTDAFHLYWQVLTSLSAHPHFFSFPTGHIGHPRQTLSIKRLHQPGLPDAKPAMYKWWHVIFIGGMCSAAICSVSFSGSFLDSLICSRWVLSLFLYR